MGDKNKDKCLQKDIGAFTWAQGFGPFVIPVTKLSTLPKVFT